MAGEEIKVYLTMHDNAVNAVLQFFAVLAYPDRKHLSKRDEFVRAVQAKIQKSRYRTANKYNGAQIRQHVRGEYLRRTNRQFQKSINRGLTGLYIRLNAGHVAYRCLNHGRYVNEFDIADDSMELALRPGTNPIRVQTGPEIPGTRGALCMVKGSYLTAVDPGRLSFGEPLTLTHLLRETVAARDTVRRNCRYGENPASGKSDAIENLKKTLRASACVLHLAAAIWDEFSRHPEFLSPSAPDVQKTLTRMTNQPYWLREALMRAEGYRQILPERVPGRLFQAETAIRFLPA
jgi:hypothetical protein